MRPDAPPATLASEQKAASRINKCDYENSCALSEVPDVNDIQRLRDQAQKYRRMIPDIDDARTKDILRTLAKESDARADDAEHEGRQLSRKPQQED